MPDWMKLSDADRTEIASETIPTLPDVATVGNELAELKLLLFRLDSIPRLRQKLEHEVERRWPRPRPGPGESEPDPKLVNLAIGSLTGSVVIRNEAELTAWLDSLGSRIRTSLGAGAPLRLPVCL